MTISRNDLATLLVDQLAEHVAEHIPAGRVWRGRAETVPTVSATDDRVVPYAVVYPSPGTPSDDRPLDDGRRIDLLWTWQVSAAAGYPQDLDHLVDVITGFCDGWAPAVTGLSAERATQVNDPGPQRRDDTQAPPRFWLPLTYQQLITT